MLPVREVGLQGWLLSTCSRLQRHHRRRTLRPCTRPQAARVGVLLLECQRVAGRARDALLALAVAQPPRDAAPVVHQDEDDGAKHLRAGGWAQSWAQRQAHGGK